jgi:DNA-binding response OmpR family regulator
MKKKILLVDTDDTQCNLLRAILEENNYLADFFLNGEDALMALRIESYDLLVTDIMIRDFPDNTFLARIKKISPNIPIILLTAFNDKTILNEFTKSGLDCFIEKPYEQDEMLAKIKSLMRGK